MRVNVLDCYFTRWGCLDGGRYSQQNKIKKLDKLNRKVILNKA